MIGEDNGKEAHIEEARAKTKEELENGEVMEEVCRSEAAWLKREREGSDQRSGWRICCNIGAVVRYARLSLVH